MKIGRNEPCPCGSGKKFKKCCKDEKKFQPAAPEKLAAVTLSGEVEKLQNNAAKKKAAVQTMGVFIFASTEDGDGWLLEMTDMDGLKVCTQGKIIDVEINESPETIEVNWSHRFAIRKKRFFVTDYKTREEMELTNLPTHSIFAAIKRIRKKFPKQLLASIHLDEE
jgi:uncharacterized protein YecA (UPF0149 family)